MTGTVYTGAPAATVRERVRRLAPPAAAAGAAAVACAVVWWGDPTTPGGPLPVCPTKALFGLTCPGCGGMRMLYSLLHGDLAAALHFNAVTVVLLALCLWSFAAWTVGRWRGRWVRTWLHLRWTPVAFGVVFVAWFVLRNLPFAPFTALAV
ncbi:uncharacterized protein DUF2752 [Prauserella shujinwangii]|uniref:Uncharacterized protein DUF2752 n=1 Tax=Prauserella shujinwangii TaxID=1453103 RepID=A0A2T0LTN4_9PSEU|nr:DUF2752 domain-containing protein [Prauserella shujinwangii]PRX47099.1 uncharacterized protein DUF2752 [Prauserella shujinwangii]